jgi:hypothetical protein
MVFLSNMFAAVLALALWTAPAVPLAAPTGSKDTSFTSPSNVASNILAADLVVVGRFNGRENDRKARAKIEVIQRIKGPPASNVVACFRASALTVTPPLDSRWIFLLQKPFLVTNRFEYRRVVGDRGNSGQRLPDDYEGILSATPENLQFVRRVLAENHER